MKQNLSNLLIVFLITILTICESCFGCGDMIFALLQNEQIHSWNELVGVFRGHCQNEYIILHNDTTYTHIFISNDDTIKSVGKINFYLCTNNFSTIRYENWKTYINYLNDPIFTKPEIIINKNTLRYGCSDFIEYDFCKLDWTENNLKKLHCNLESAY